MSQDQAELSMFPFARNVGDLASPPDGRLDGPVTRVRLQTGRTAWLVTRHAEVRQMLRNEAFSSDTTNPGFPAPALALAVPADEPTMRSRSIAFGPEHLPVTW
jgi:cytochrome P450